MSSPSLRQTIRAALALGTISAALLADPVAPRADPLPLPTIDYEARAKIANAGEMVIRHSKGRVRVEFSIPGTGQPIIGIADLNKKKIVMILKIPGLDQTTAFEIDFGEELGFGQVVGDGRRVGTSTAAGEPCTLWEIPAKAGKATACIGSDNILLKTEAEIAGQQQAVFEVTQVNRRRQNPADFEVPAGVNVVRLPKGLKIPGMQ
jgi:hypothetical protein